MRKRFMAIAIECIVDLGVTVAYAALAGLLVVAIAASDEGPLTITSFVLYAGILPTCVIVLIGCDAGLRVFTEVRQQRRREARNAGVTSSFGPSRTA